MFIPTVFAQGAQFNTAREETTTGLAQFFADFFTAVPLWIAAGIVFFASFLVASFVKKIVSYRISKKAQYQMNREVIILIERTVWFCIVMLGAIIAFGIVGINIAALLGFLGLGLGFAFKDLLANFIAGVVILTQKKFHIGDTVKVNGIMGKITEIETRTTQIQAFDGTMHIIPNAEMLTTVVQNFTTNSFRRIEFVVGVHYNTPLAEAVKLTLNSVKKHQAVVPDPAPAVIVSEFGDSSINLIVRFWIESTAPWPRIKSEVMQTLKQDFDGAGITIPFPIRTLTLDSYDPNILKATHLPADAPAFNFPADVSVEGQNQESGTENQEGK